MSILPGVSKSAAEKAIEDAIKGNGALKPIEDKLKRYLRGEGLRLDDNKTADLFATGIAAIIPFLIKSGGVFTKGADLEILLSAGLEAGIAGVIIAKNVKEIKELIDIIRGARSKEVDFGAGVLTGTEGKSIIDARIKQQPGRFGPGVGPVIRRPGEKKEEKEEKKPTRKTDRVDFSALTSTLTEVSEILIDLIEDNGLNPVETASRFRDLLNRLGVANAIGLKGLPAAIEAARFKFPAGATVVTADQILRIQNALKGSDVAKIINDLENLLQPEEKEPEEPEGKLEVKEAPEEKISILERDLEIDSVIDRSTLPPVEKDALKRRFRLAPFALLDQILAEIGIISVTSPGSVDAIIEIIKKLLDDEGIPSPVPEPRPDPTETKEEKKPKPEVEPEDPEEKKEEKKEMPDEPKPTKPKPNQIAKAGPGEPTLRPTYFAAGREAVRETQAEKLEDQRIFDDWDNINNKAPTDKANNPMYQQNLAEKFLAGFDSFTLGEANRIVSIQGPKSLPAKRRPFLFVDKRQDLSTFIDPDVMPIQTRRPVVNFPAPEPTTKKGVNGERPMEKDGVLPERQRYVNTLAIAPVNYNSVIQGSLQPPLVDFV